MRLKKRHKRRIKVRKVVVPPPEVNVYYQRPGSGTYAYLSNTLPQHVESDIAFRGKNTFSGSIALSPAGTEIQLQEAGSYLVAFMIRAADMNRIGFVFNQEVISEAVFVSEPNGFNAGQYVLTIQGSGTLKVVNVTGHPVQLRDEQAVNASVFIQKLA